MDTMASTIFHPAAERGHVDHGWLNAWHSFSFASWHDPRKMHFGALRVLNDDTIAGGMGFGTHPHNNMEIITIVLEGELEHRDSMGNSGVIHPNEVQVMSAGTGVTHSEFNHNPTTDCRLFQLWVFPNRRNVTPRYDQHKFSPEERKDKLQLLVSPMDTEDGGMKIYQEAWIYRAQLSAGNSITHQLHSENHGAYILNVNGQFTAADKQLNRRDAVGIADTEMIVIEASEDSDILIVEVPLEF